MSLFRPRRASVGSGEAAQRSAEQTLFNADLYPSSYSMPRGGRLQVACSAAISGSVLQAVSDCRGHEERQTSTLSGRRLQTPRILRPRRPHPPHIMATAAAKHPLPMPAVRQPLRWCRKGEPLAGAPCPSRPAHFSAPSIPAPFLDSLPRFSRSPCPRRFFVSACYALPFPPCLDSPRGRSVLVPALSYLPACLPTCPPVCLSSLLSSHPRPAHTLDVPAMRVTTLLGL